ncbi:MAG: hypothetical protein CL676_12465 [Bdellovibrionaceae bacterium]|mgnify:CR=1 FL=1|nr:hypothetical protein [Pseudobdellovibrionaceae bacterium]|tara:strand:- start:1329 stop:2408 length:1080 start_codon:yes stop_codon:yes gene_type:complete
MRTVTSEKTYFKILQIAGEGLNSTVYKTLREDFSGSISQMVALKVLRSKNSVSFWKQEVQSLLKVDSPFCVKVFGYEWIDGHPSMVLEWLNGIELNEYLKDHQPSKEHALELVSQIYRGLMDLHLSGLNHGDLHLGNVFVTDTGQVKLIDFGLANVSRVSEQGTPLFRAPELETGVSPNLWTDLFSLGRVAESLGINPGELLSPAPHLRSFHNLTSNPEAQMEIGDHIQRILNQKKLQQESQTQHLESPIPSTSLLSKKLLGLLPLAFFLATSSASQKEFLSQACPVEIRTREWTQIQIDKAIDQYAPVQLKKLPCHKVVTLKWKRSGASGTLRFKPSPAKSPLILTDKDFSLDHMTPN